MHTNLTEPRFTQPDVLAVTGLRSDQLQTWVSRSVITLTDHNPGTGKRRLYSRVDVVKLAVMRRFADLRVDLAVALEVAEEAAKRLVEERGIDWNEHLILRPRPSSPIAIIHSSGASAMARLGTHIVGDADDIRVATLIEPTFARRSRRNPEGVRAICPDTRDHLAAHGIHAEPAILFPIGEIVNGTLMQLNRLIPDGS